MYTCIHMHTYTHAYICFYRGVCLSLRWFLSRGVLSEGFCLESFVRGCFSPFPYCRNIRYNRKLNITLNFRFHMYDKSKSVTSHALDILLCHKLSHILGPSTLGALRTFWTAPHRCSCGCIVGPTNWSSIDKACAGRYQSPINIDLESTKLNELLTEISVVAHNVTGDSITLTNNRHTNQSDPSFVSK